MSTLGSGEGAVLAPKSQLSLLAPDTLTQVGGTALLSKEFCCPLLVLGIVAPGMLTQEIATALLPHKLCLSCLFALLLQICLLVQGTVLLFCKFCPSCLFLFGVLAPCALDREVGTALLAWLLAPASCFLLPASCFLLPASCFLAPGSWLLAPVDSAPGALTQETGATPQPFPWS